MKHRLNHETREQTEEQSSLARDESTTFDSVDEMMRQDAANTTVPPLLGERVMRSIAREPLEKSPSPWWKRWMPF